MNAFNVNPPLLVASICCDTLRCIPITQCSKSELGSEPTQYLWFSYTSHTDAEIRITMQFLTHT
jgi:hypothetical protein